MLDYDGSEADARKENVRILRQSLEGGKVEGWLKKKITSFSKRHDLESELIEYKLLHDDLFFLSFIKEPTRQSFHQQLAYRELCSFPEVARPRLLDSKGPNAKFLIGGIVVENGVKNGVTDRSKSIDFEWSVSLPGRTIQCYATHKFTREGGGSQDNQFNDVCGFLEVATRNTATDNFFFAICDGDYYQKPYKNCTSRIEYLNKHYMGHRCLAVTINTLRDTFADL